MKDFLKRFYLDFDSRASRSEFWWTALVVFIVLFIMVFLDYLLETSIYGIFGYLTLFFTLILILPFSSTMTRRLNDTNRNGLWTKLFYFINIVFIFLLNYGLHCENKSAFLSHVSISVFALTFYNLWLILTLCEKPVLPEPIKEDVVEEEVKEINEDIKNDIMNQLDKFDK